MAESELVPVIVTRYVDPEVRNRAALEEILASVPADQRTLFATLARVVLSDQATAEVASPNDAYLMGTRQIRELKEQLIRTW